MEQLRQYIPYLEPELEKRLDAEGLIRKYSTGSYLLKQGSFIPGLPIVVNGRVKVIRQGEKKDFLLYYILAGESCIMSYSGCIHQQTSEVAAIVEEDAEVLIIPVDKLSRWMSEYSSLNRFILDLYQKRYIDLLDTLDQLVFLKLEDRLMKYLEKQADTTGSETLILTHQQIAKDLGSSREVISRVLKKLEVSGKVVQSPHIIRLK